MARPGRAAGPLESASNYVGGAAGPVPSHDEPTTQRNARAADDEKALRQWAFNYYDNVRDYRLPPIKLGQGAEHEVYDKGRRVIKVTRKSEGANYGFGISLNNDGRGATASEYLDRLRLSNLIFNDDVRLEGVLALAGNTKIATSQPFINGEPASPRLIDDYMAAKGFDRLTEGMYYLSDLEVLVHDLHPRNVVATPTGHLRAIDAAIMRAKPELAEFIRLAAR